MEVSLRDQQQQQCNKRRRVNSRSTHHYSPPQHHQLPRPPRNSNNNEVRIIHLHEPRVIKTDVTHFKEIVQKLTGKPPPEEKICNTTPSPISVLEGGGGEGGGNGEYCHKMEDDVMMMNNGLFAGEMESEGLMVKNEYLGDYGYGGINWEFGSEYRQYHQFPSSNCSVYDYDNPMFGHLM